MFNFLKKAFSKVYQQVSAKLGFLFNKETIDEESLQELERILISSDAGIHTTRTIIDALKKRLQNGSLQKGSDLKNYLKEELLSILQAKTFNPQADIYLLIGINGSGKTTFAAKLGYWLKNQGKSVLFIAADTFRAAATEQLNSWGKKLSIPVVEGKENQEPASLIYEGTTIFKQNSYDSLIIDTAGRLQTKINLMKELEKVKRILEKQAETKKVVTLLTIDAMLGQNSFDQAKQFHEATNVDGIVLTKMDGTGKGGIVFSIVQELKIPIAFISYGEEPDQLIPFNAQDYIDQLLS